MPVLTTGFAAGRIDKGQKAIINKKINTGKNR
jgi:hypothetical protein